MSKSNTGQTPQCLPGQQNFSPQQRDAFYQIVQARRDMRHFTPNQAVDDVVLTRILIAAHLAPSVGLMQPWRFIRIRKDKLRQDIAALVEQERLQTAKALAERKEEFLKLKIEGVRECAELLVVVQAEDDGTIFGRRTMMQEMALCSTACAIQNLWLAARAENLGMGWVSMFEPERLRVLLRCPAAAQPLAILCLGPVDEFYPEPMLEMEDWRQGRELNSVMAENYWDEMGAK